MNPQPTPEMPVLKIGTSRVPAEQIVLLMGYGNYTRAVLVDGAVLLSTKTLATFELPARAMGFVRVHKSFIINQLHLQSVSKAALTLQYFAKHVPISRRRYGQDLGNQK